MKMFYRKLDVLAVREQVSLLLNLVAIRMVFSRLLHHKWGGNRLSVSVRTCTHRRSSKRIDLRRLLEAIYTHAHSATHAIREYEIWDEVITLKNL